MLSSHFITGYLIISMRYRQLLQLGAVSDSRQVYKSCSVVSERPVVCHHSITISVFRMKSVCFAWHQKWQRCCWLQATYYIKEPCRIYFTQSHSVHSWYKQYCIQYIELDDTHIITSHGSHMAKDLLYMVEVPSVWTPLLPLFYSAMLDMVGQNVNLDVHDPSCEQEGEKLICMCRLVRFILPLRNIYPGLALTYLHYCSPVTYSDSAQQNAESGSSSLKANWEILWEGTVLDKVCVGCQIL